jgi:hypothetical protein
VRDAINFCVERLERGNYLRIGKVHPHAFVTGISGCGFTMSVAIDFAISLLKAANSFILADPSISLMGVMGLPTIAAMRNNDAGWIGVF